ncbi:MAG: hypothetical protein HQL25_02235 [Candidatus Omnitrophica bacterium]|nr:hypothetical protein [Candidatus Omnitrophota bacterium]
MSNLFSKQLFILLIGCCLIQNPNLSFSMDESPYESEARLTNSLYNHGIQQLKTNNIEGAINDFCRVLLIDPSNALTQEQLIRLSNETKLTSFNKIQLVYFRDLITGINNVVKQIQYFELKINQISKNQIAENNAIKQDRNFAKPEYSNDISLDNRNFLEILNDMLRVQRDHLTLKLNQTIEKYDQLKEQNKLAISNFYTPQNIYTSETRMSNIPRTNPKINSADNGKIIDMSLRLTEKDLQINKNEERFAQIKNELKELQARFDLGQQLLEQKQSSMDTLQQQLLQITTQLKSSTEELSAALLQREENLIEANGILNIYKEKFLEAQDNIKTKNRDVQKVESLTNLKVQKYSEVIKKLETEHSDLLESQQVLAIYQQKFKDAYIRLKKKDADVSTLNEQLELSQKILFERDKIIKRAQANLDNINDQLKVVKSELEQIKISSTTNNPEQIANREQLTSLNNRITDIQNLIKDNVNDLKVSSKAIAVK